MKRILSVAFIVVLVSAFCRADDFSKSINSAKILLKNKDYDGAITLLKPVPEGDALYGESMLLIGQCQEKQGQIPEAVASYQACVEKAKDESIKKQAKVLLDRLDEGKKVLAKYAEQLQQEAAKFKGKNQTACDTIMAGAAMLQGDAPIQGVEKALRAKMSERRQFETMLVGTNWEYAGQIGGHPIEPLRLEFKDDGQIIVTARKDAKVSRWRYAVLGPKVVILQYGTAVSSWTTLLRFSDDMQAFQEVRGGFWAKDFGGNQGKSLSAR